MKLKNQQYEVLGVRPSDEEEYFLWFEKVTDIFSQISKRYTGDFSRSVTEFFKEQESPNQMISVLLTTDRGTIQQLRRTSFCSQIEIWLTNYKFSEEFTVIIPYQFREYLFECSLQFPEELHVDTPYFAKEWVRSLVSIERIYLKLLQAGRVREAYSLLPNCACSQIMFFGTSSEWNQMFEIYADSTYIDIHVCSLFRQIQSEFNDKNLISV